jgi:hypothetical protein
MAFDNDVTPFNSSPSTDPRGAQASANPTFSPSDALINSVAYIPIATGALSLAGSSLILVCLYRTKRNARNETSHRGSSVNRVKKQTSQVYHRILVAMSIYDVGLTHLLPPGILGSVGLRFMRIRRVAECLLRLNHSIQCHRIIHVPAH